MLKIAGARLSSAEKHRFENYRYGPGVFKMDWALSGSVPWSAPECREAATVHLGGTLEEVARSEAEVGAGRHPERPYCIAVQPCVADPGRAVGGTVTLTDGGFIVDAPRDVQEE